MIKILVVAPYEGLKTLFSALAPEYPEYEIRIEESNLEAGVPLARKAVEDGFDVILSRGGTADLIAAQDLIPVVKIDVSGFDILRSITIAQNVAGKKAVVGFSSVTHGYSSICRLLGSDIDIYTVDSQEQVLPILTRLREEQVELVIGDVITTQLAKSLGMNGMLITSGEESIRSAMEQVGYLENYIRLYQRKSQALQQAFKGADLSVRLFDGHGCELYSYGEFGSDFPDLSGYLAGQISRVPASGSLQLVVRGEAGDACQVEGSRVAVEEGQEYILFTLRRAQPLPEGVRGLSVKNADELPVVSYNMCSSRNEEYQQTVEKIRLLSHTPSNLLLEGEFGTGKDRLALLVYQDNNTSPLLAVDCMAADEQTMEQLFSERYFVGGQRPLVLWEHLDTLGEAAQRALRALSEQLARFRHIATTEHNLQDLCAVGRFDPALYQAFAFSHVWIPPLRQRREDLESIVTILISQENEQLGKQVVGVSREALERIHSYEWYGNIDQLEKVLHQAMLLTQGPYISAQVISPLLSTEEKSNNIYGILPNMTLEDIEKEIILFVLREENMNQVQAARRLGISRTTLWR